MRTCSGSGSLAGPRWEALCTLEWSQVNFETMEITVRNKRSAHSKATGPTTISIDSEMLKVLLAQKGKHPCPSSPSWARTQLGRIRRWREYKAGQLYPITPVGVQLVVRPVKRRPGSPTFVSMTFAARRVVAQTAGRARGGFQAPGALLRTRRQGTTLTIRLRTRDARRCPRADAASTSEKQTRRS